MVALLSADLGFAPAPGGVAGGPALLVYPNFRTIMTWNRSISTPSRSATLADRIAGVEPPGGAAGQRRALSRTVQILILQQLK